MNTYFRKAVATTVLTAGLSATAVSPASAVVDIGHPIFNDPRGSASEQRAIVDDVIRSIKTTRRGDAVLIAIYSFQDPEMARQMIAAHRRGVNVNLIVNGHLDVPTYQWVKRVLGTDRSKRSFVYDRGSEPGVFHPKLYLIYRGSNDNVVYFGSSNVTNRGMRRQYNVLHKVTDNVELFKKFRLLFRQYKSDGTPAPMDFTVGGITVHTYPRPMGPRKDPVARTLRAIDCHLSKRSRYGFRGRTVVAIEMHGWQQERGVRLARLVRELHIGGCKVRIMYGDSVGGRVESILRGVTSISPLPDLYHYTHKKVLMVNGKIRGKPNKLVWTGSPNWSNTGRDVEVLVELDSNKAYVNYRTGFNETWKEYRD